MEPPEADLRQDNGMNGKGRIRLRRMRPYVGIVARDYRVDSTRLPRRSVPRSIRVVCQGYFRTTGWRSGCQGVPRRATALSCSSSLRMMATSATLPGLPRLRNRS